MRRGVLFILGIPAGVGGGAAPDPSPDQFTFVDATDTMLSTVYESNQITVTGINVPTTISVTGGEYNINGGAFTSSAGTVGPGDDVIVRGTSSGSVSTNVDVTLDIGGVTDTFRITTSIAEAAALFARFSVQPVQARRTKIRTMISSLLAGALSGSNIWAKLDALYVFAAANSQGALLNWIGSTFDATAVNTPTFTADQGFQGNGTSSYLDTNFNPTTAVSPKFVAADAIFGLYSNTVGTGSTSDGGWFDGTDGTTILIRNASNAMQARLSCATARTAAGVTDGTGLFTISRNGTAASNIRLQRRTDTLTPAAGGATVALNNASFRIGSSAAASFSTRQFAGGVIGAFLTEAENDDLSNAYDAYLSGL